MLAANTVRQMAPSTPSPSRIIWKLELILTNLLHKYLPGSEKPKCSGWLLSYTNRESKKAKQSGSFHFTDHINMLILFLESVYTALKTRKVERKGDMFIHKLNPMVGELLRRSGGA